MLKQRVHLRANNFICGGFSDRRWDLISVSHRTECHHRSARDITSTFVVSAHYEVVTFVRSTNTNCIFLVKVKPLIKVSNQLVAAPVNSDVLLQCYVESSPKALNTWYRNNGEKTSAFVPCATIQILIYSFRAQTLINITRSCFFLISVSSFRANFLFINLADLLIETFSIL